MTFDLTKSSLSHADAELFLSIRKIFSNGISLEEVTALRPDLTMSQICDFLNRLSAAGIVEWKAKRCFADVTMEGMTLAADGLKPRIGKAEAEKVLNAAIIRARKWNADAKCPVVISELRLFGSFLNEQADYGDVDIEVVCAERPLGEAEWEAHIAALPVSAMRDYFCWSDPKRAVLGRGAKKAMQAMRRVSKSLAVTPQGTIDRIGADWRQVYCFDVASAKDVKPNPTHHPRTSPIVASDEVNHVPVTDFLELGSVDVMPEILGEMTSQYIAEHAEAFWWGLRDDDGVRSAPDMDDKFINRGVKATKWVDAVPAWPISATEPFAALLEILARGIEAGHLTDGPIWFDFSQNSVTCEFWMPPVLQDGDELTRQLVFNVRLDAKGKRDVVLTPTMRTVWASDEGDEDEISGHPDHIAMARSLSHPLFAMLAEMSFTSGADTLLSFQWDPRDVAPKLPKLGGLIKHVAAEARDITISRKHLPGFATTLAKCDMEGCLYFKKKILLEIRGTTQVFDDEGLEPGGEMISVNGSSNASIDWPAKETSLDLLRDEDAFVERARSFIPRLNGLGDSWLITLERKFRKYTWPKSADVAAIEATIVSEKLSLV